MQVKHNMCPIANEDALLGIFQSFGFQILQFLEESWNVENNSGTDQIIAVGVDKSRWQKMEIERNSVCDNGVPSIVCKKFNT